jgi:peptidoglycan/LPS O-acetylase OafA/YrhL
MGYLRFLLALTVIFSHSNAFFGIEFLPGNIAVEAFFIISGFYMALVLKEKYFLTPKYYKLFITNRLLRLYPMYWLILLLMVTAGLVHGYYYGQYGNLQVFSSYWHSLKPSTLIFLIASNVLVLGQDIFYFFTTSSNGGLHFTKNTFSSHLVLYRFIVDLPLWTVSLEIMFYLISPFFVKLRYKPLIVIIGLLLLVRLVLKIEGVSYDPLIYRLFPLQIVFFLAGILCYHVYTRIKHIEVSKPLFYSLITYISAFTFAYGSIADSEIKDFIYLFSVFCMVPLLFKFTKSSKIDRWLGELSYPMYITHMLVILSGRNILQHLHIDLKYYGICFSVVTIAFSFLLVALIGKRLENYRARRVKAKIAVIETDTYQQPAN